MSGELRVERGGGIRSLFFACNCFLLYYTNTSKIFIWPVYLWNVWNVLVILLSSMVMAEHEVKDFCVLRVILRLLLNESGVPILKLLWIVL